MFSSASFSGSGQTLKVEHCPEYRICDSSNRKQRILLFQRFLGSTWFSGFLSIIPGTSYAVQVNRVELTLGDWWGTPLKSKSPLLKPGSVKNWWGLKIRYDDYRPPVFVVTDSLICVVSPCVQLYKPVDLIIQYEMFLPIPESFLVPSDMISTWSPSTS